MGEEEAVEAERIVDRLRAAMRGVPRERWFNAMRRELATMRQEYRWGRFGEELAA